MEHQEQIKHLFDAFSISAVVGTIIGMLPAIAAILSIVWTVIRIYETKTVQKFLANRRKRHGMQD